MASAAAVTIARTDKGCSIGRWAELDSIFGFLADVSLQKQRPNRGSRGAANVTPPMKVTDLDQLDDSVIIALCFREGLMTLVQQRSIQASADDAQRKLNLMTLRYRQVRILPMPVCVGCYVP